MKVIEHMPRMEALCVIYEHCKRTLETEYVSLLDACGRVASRDICSRLNLPDTPCSRWDGISFSYDNYASCNGCVTGWVEGIDYKYTNTGIAIFHEGFDTMVKIEDTEFEAGALKAIHQNEPIEKGQNVIPVGERMAFGEVLVKKDTLITPSHLNRLASGGNLNVPVYRKPVVAILPSGDELTACSDTPVRGQTIESNTYSMRSKAAKWGGSTLVFPIIKDNTAMLQQRLKEAVLMADLVVICGGSGRGQHDLLRMSMAEIGTLYFSSIEHGPGKRTCFAVIDETPVIGLVGPPGGEEMTFDFYVVPAIRAILHQHHQETKVKVILDEEVPPHKRADFFYTMKIYRGEDGQLHGRSLPHAQLDRNIAEHNGYLFVRKEGNGYKKGEIVTAELRIGYENV